MADDSIAPPDAPSLSDFGAGTTAPPSAGDGSAPAAGRGAAKRPSGGARRTAARAAAAKAARQSVRAEATAGDTAPPRPGKPSSDDKLRKSLVDLYVQVGVVTSIVGRGEDGAVIGQNAAACADAWVELARTNPRVRKALEAMLTGSAWGGVLMAHAPIVLAVMVNHGATVPGVAALTSVPDVGAT